MGRLSPWDRRVGERNVMSGFLYIDFASTNALSQEGTQIGKEGLSTAHVSGAQLLRTSASAL